MVERLQIHKLIGNTNEEDQLLDRGLDQLHQMSFNYY